MEETTPSEGFGHNYLDEIYSDAVKVIIRGHLKYTNNMQEIYDELCLEFDDNCLFLGFDARELSCIFREVENEYSQLKHMGSTHD